MPGESHRQRSLIGYSPRGRKELDTTERLHFHFLSLSQCGTRNEDFGEVALYHKHFVFVQSLSHVRLCVTPWTAAPQASLSFTITQSLLKLISTVSVMPSNHLVLCHPLLLLPSMFPSIRMFSGESALYIRWPKYWSFSISPSNKYSGFVSFRIHRFDLAVQGTLKSL